MHGRYLMAWCCWLLPMLFVALPLAAEQQGVVAMVLLLAVVAVSLLREMLLLDLAGDRQVVRARELSLPPPLAVAIPKVPSRPRAPGLG